MRQMTTAKSMMQALKDSQADFDLYKLRVESMNNCTHLTAVLGPEPLVTLPWACSPQCSP